MPLRLWYSIGRLHRIVSNFLTLSDQKKTPKSGTAPKTLGTWAQRSSCAPLQDVNLDKLFCLGYVKSLLPSSLKILLRWFTISPPLQSLAWLQSQRQSLAPTQAQVAGKCPPCISSAASGKTCNAYIFHATHQWQVTDQGNARSNSLLSPQDIWCCPKTIVTHNKSSPGIVYTACQCHLWNSLVSKCTYLGLRSCSLNDHNNCSLHGISNSKERIQLCQLKLSRLAMDSTTQLGYST